MQTTTMVNHHSMFAIHTTLTPGEEVENKELILGGFWLRLKESYRASPDTFTVRRATLTVFFTYVVPILIAGATFCIPLEPAFEGREANRTFLWVVYPMQQFLRFAGCAQVTCVFANDGRKMTKWNFAINMAVALLFTLFLWILLLFLSDNWAFPVPFFDVYTGPLCIPLIGATITALRNWIGNKEPSSVAPEKADPPPLAQDAPDGAKLKLKLHGKLSDDSPYRHFFAVMDYGIPSCWVVIPLSSGLFQATSGYGQNAAVLGLAGARLGYRMLVKRTSEQWLRPDQRMCFLFLMGIVIDLMYEFHCALLFGAFDTTISMMIPPVVDLIDNIWVIRKCVNEKNTQLGRSGKSRPPSPRPRRSRWCQAQAQAPRETLRRLSVQALLCRYGLWNSLMLGRNSFVFGPLPSYKRLRTKRSGAGACGGSARLPHAR